MYSCLNAFTLKTLHKVNSSAFVQNKGLPSSTLITTNQQLSIPKKVLI